MQVEPASRAMRRIFTDATLRGSWNARRTPHFSPRDRPSRFFAERESNSPIDLAVGQLRLRFSAWVVIRQQTTISATIRLKWPANIGLCHRQRSAVAIGKDLHRRPKEVCSWATSQLAFSMRLKATATGANSIPRTRGKKRQKLESYITLKTPWRAVFAMGMNLGQ